MSVKKLNEINRALGHLCAHIGLTGPVHVRNKKSREFRCINRNIYLAQGWGNSNR